MPTDIGSLEGRLGLGIVAVVGAGLSMGARYPNTYGLNALLWDAIDTDLDARQRLADRLCVEDAPAKMLIGDDWDAWETAWTAIEESVACRERFQTEFVHVDATRSGRPSVSHEALARLIHAGIVECVVSLNWDSALEQAYRRLYGTDLPVGVLHKPHGDVARPDLPWALPHEDGRIDQDLLDRVRALVADHPRTLLIVGYSESDRAVVEQLIAPLDETWRVARVGLSATGAEDVFGTADEVLHALAAPFEQRENDSAWHSVASWGTRGIEGALDGRRLEARDVLACPRLPEADRLVAALRRDHSVVLNGPSGCGKSITAYQALNDLREDGYEILRLRDRSRHAGKNAWLTDLSTFPQRKVLFIDDAQDLQSDTVREFAEAATPQRLVLVVGVDHVAGGVTTIRLNEGYAVGTLEHYVRQHRAEMQALVTRLDNRVGTRIGYERFEDRLAAAAREKTPWQFFFTLTGGWRRIVDRVTQVQDSDRADLAVLALAVAQIASVDAGVAAEALLPYAEALGRDGDWLARSLETLKRERLAVETDGVWRCAHLRAARALLIWALHPPTWMMPPTPAPVVVGPIASASEAATGAAPEAEPPPVRPAQTLRLPKTVVEAHRETITLLVETALAQPTTSMRGVAWLICDHSHEVQWVMGKQRLRTEQRDRGLVQRALQTPVGADVAMAAQLITQLAWPEVDHVVDETWNGIETVIGWVRDISPEEGWALGDLVNALSKDRERLAGHLADLDAQRLARLVIDGGWPHIYSTTRALGRITQGGGPDLMRAVAEQLDEQRLAQMLQEAPNLASIDTLLECLVYLDPDLALRLFHGVASRAADMFSSDPLTSHHDLYRTVMFVLGFAPDFLHPDEPSAAQVEASIRFTDAIDPDALARAMCTRADERLWHNFPHFLSFFYEANPEGLAEVVTRLDLGAAEANLVDELPRPRSATLFVLMLATMTREQEVHALLERHSDGLTELSHSLVWAHPDLAVTLLRRGVPFDLGLASQNYKNAADLLDRIAAANDAVAAELAEANAAAFSAGLAANHQPPFVDIDAWLASCDRVAPGWADRILADLAPEVVAGWQRFLSNGEDRTRVLALAERVGSLAGTEAAVAAAALAPAAAVTHDAE